MCNKTKNKKGFASAGQPLFSNSDFMRLFNDRVSELIKREVENHFSDMMWK